MSKKIEKDKIDITPPGETTTALQVKEQDSFHARYYDRETGDPLPLEVMTERVRMTFSRIEKMSVEVMLDLYFIHKNWSTFYKRGDSFRDYISNELPYSRGYVYEIIRAVESVVTYFTGDEPLLIENVKKVVDTLGIKEVANLPGYKEITSTIFDDILNDKWNGKKVDQYCNEYWERKYQQEREERFSKQQENTNDDITERSTEAEVVDVQTADNEITDDLNERIEPDYSEYEYSCEEGGFVATTEYDDLYHELSVSVSLRSDSRGVAFYLLKFYAPDKIEKSTREFIIRFALQAYVRNIKTDETSIEENQ